MEDYFDFTYPLAELSTHLDRIATLLFLVAFLIVMARLVAVIFRRFINPDIARHRAITNDPEPIPTPAEPSAQVKRLDELIVKLTSRETKDAKKELQDIKSWIQDLTVKDPKDELNARASVQSDLQTIFGIAEKLIGIQQDRGQDFHESRHKALANIQVRGENIHAWVKKANQRNIAMIDSYDEINHGSQIKALRELEK